MPNNFHLSFVLDKAKSAFGDRPLFKNVRLPLTLTNGYSRNRPSFIVAPALWTRDGFQPQWDNLAVVASELENSEGLSLWRDVLIDLGIPLGIFVSNDSFFLASRAASGEIRTQQIAVQELVPLLRERNPDLFTPRSLGALRAGQLSFADVEERVTEDSFNFHLRYHAQLSQSLENAITSALIAELDAQSRIHGTSHISEANSVYDSIIIVAIAYLAARILEDKGFFESYQMPTANVQELLVKTRAKINGFFQNALYTELPRVSDEALQQLSIELGTRAIFTLVDHHDVAEIYEKAIRTPLEVSQLEFAAFTNSLPDLQQHYTPIKLAERMLEFLPLERLRPEDRRIFDPAAGSGTLLLAASQRLAAMSDLPLDRELYLANQIAGNDLDPNANLIMRVRYTLSRQTIGATLPAPTTFSARDFQDYTRDTLPNAPRVIVANPPFGKEQKTQRAAEFLNLVTQWLSENDQFAVILPDSFLTASTHGIGTARRNLAARCHLFEVIQLPEGVVGVKARQAVCVVIGCIGKIRHIPTMVRSTISGAMSQAARESGFLGQAWMGEVGETPDHWKALLAPPLNLPTSTIKLRDLYYTFTGVKLYPHFQPVKEPIKGVTKPYWSVGWKLPGRIWADPLSRPVDKQYVRYGAEFMEGPRLQNEHLFDLPKLMVGRSVNRNAVDPLAACLDTEGLCPNVDVHCIATWESKGTPERIHNAPTSWRLLTNEEKLLWLLGIMTSALASEISLRGRSARHLESDQLRDFPLPITVDPRIIVVVRQMLERDQAREPLNTPDLLRAQLNDLVEETYGRPVRITTLARTGVSPEYAVSQAEKETPSIIVTGQVRDVSLVRGEILLWLQGIRDEVTEAWIPLPPHTPGWALDGDVFTADLSNDIETFSQLVERPWSLRNFRHTPRPYLTVDELRKEFAAS